MKYTKYKNRIKLVLTGDDDMFISSLGSMYKTTGSYINGKTIRFNLNSSFNDLKLSQNARCIMEACYVPNLAGLSNYIFVRLGASTNDKALDSKLFLRGNPVIAVFKGTDQTILNCSEFFYNLNVPSKFLQCGYIDVQVESPVVAGNVDFITGFPLSKFFISLIIIDEDDEMTQDDTLAPSVEFKNYGRLGMLIRNIRLKIYFYSPEQRQ
jgi:hypothetical protein